MVPPLPTLPISHIARIAHEANRAYQLGVLDCLHHAEWPTWDDAPRWMQESAIAGVAAIINDPASTAEQSHERWMAHKEHQGWVYGPVKDGEKKTHPCMVPYAQLPPSERIKDHLFHGIVLSLIGPTHSAPSKAAEKINESLLNRSEPDAAAWPIQIQKSPTADTRTCDVSTVTLEQLGRSSRQHIKDVGLALEMFQEILKSKAILHDHDKLSLLDWFHKDFQTGFKETGWWDNHRRINRHHLGQADGVPADVNLLDVLEYIADCVMAGMARSGSVYDLAISESLLKLAFENTVALLKKNVTVAPAEEAIDG